MTLMGRENNLSEHRGSPLCRAVGLAYAPRLAQVKCQTQMKSPGTGKTESSWDDSAQAWIAAVGTEGDWGRQNVLDPVMIAQATAGAPWYLVMTWRKPANPEAPKS